MTKIFIFLAVCILLDCRSIAQTTSLPLTTAEADNRIAFLQHFSQPIELRAWEVRDDAMEGWKRWDLSGNFFPDRGNLPMISDLRALHPYFRDKIIELIRLCRLKGIELTIIETYRTPAKQNEYKTKGRMYTQLRGGQSWHQYGMAVDLVPVIDSVQQWRNLALWRKVGATGERLGLRWGGRWRYPFDPGHFEWSYGHGLSTRELAQGIYPSFAASADYPCLEEDLKELQRNWMACEEHTAAAHKQATSLSAQLLAPGQTNPSGN